jgi:hypothetical protein
MILDDLINGENESLHLDQGSEDWENIRAGRFTASEIYKLMECGYRPMTPAELSARPKKGPGSRTTRVPDMSALSDGALTYIYQKVAETLTGRPKPSAYAYPLVYGKEMEPEAVEYFQEATGLICEEVGFQTWSDHAGGSPDRLIGDKEGLEIKCPYDSTNQIHYLMLNDRFDLKNNHPNFYWQCVSNMLFTDRERWHFVTYDPRMQLEKHKMKHLQITYREVQEDINLLSAAIEGAITKKLEIIKLLS